MKKNLAGWIGVFGAVVAIQGTLAHAEAWGEKGKLQDFVSRMDVLTNAAAIDQRGLSQATLPNRPWSSTFWPDILGSVAWRYTDYATNPVSNDLTMGIFGWGSSRHSIMGNTDIMSDSNGHHKDIMAMSQDALDKLSPPKNMTWRWATQTTLSGPR